jgi:outer membrane protein insertion porin family
LVTSARCNRRGRERLRSFWLCALLPTLLFAAWTANAQTSGELVSEIRIAGNQRVEDDAIRVHISSQPGEPYDETRVDADVKSIYKMGFFDRVEASEEHDRGKLILVYTVRERPLITQVRFEGMKKIRSTDEKVRQATKVHSRAILDPIRADETAAAIKKLYEDKGYLDASVAFKAIPQPENTAIAVFTVTEGAPVQISDIKFTGNTAFSSKRLRAVMATGTHNLLSFFTGVGTLDHKKLQEDTDRITAFYYDNGYLNVHVAQPIITRNGTKLTLTIPIDEGIPYRVGTINVTGDLKAPEKDLRDKLTLKPGEIFRGSTMQHDVLTLSDFYSNRGYAFVNVDPRTALDPVHHLVDVDFSIAPGQEVLVDRIKITGNTKTSDKVIRREMQIQEQEPYSAELIRESKARLDRTGYFGSTNITTSQGKDPSRINLNVGVTEQNTGSFQLAGGFSTSSSVFGSFKVGDSNLFGGGEAVSLDATVGFLFQNFTISYTEPWFLDIPLNTGVDLYYSKLVYLNFNRSSAGFAIRTLYPFEELGLKKIGPFSLKNVSAGLQYRFESVGVTGISGLTTFQITQFKGYSQTSEIIPTIRRFTVNNPVDPRSGSTQSLTVQIAGLGGSNYFIKGLAHTRFFWSYIDSPVWGNWVYSLGADFGIGTNLKGGTGGELPLFERYFPGGIDSVRGYEQNRLGPRVTIFNQFGQPVAFEEVGGSKELLLSTETTFPILEALGLRGVVFLDAGNSFYLSQSIQITSLQADAGGGIRWKSPFGPLRIEVAWPMNPQPGDQNVNFIFGAGSPL